MGEISVAPPISTIENGSFETCYGWGAFENGYDFVTSEAHSGTRSIVAYNHGGAQQVVSKQISGGSTVTFGGCSKSVGASTGLAEDYSIYVDIYYTDGTYLWGQTVNFDGGTTDWVCKSNSFLVPADKTVQQMNVHALYRSDPLDGTVYYDDVEISVAPPISTIENGSFETCYGWGAFGNGYDFVTSEAHSGTRSIVAYNYGGAQQVVSKEISGGSTVIFGGCSKSVGASTGLAEDYSIYVDIYYTDGTYLWGQTVNFDGGT